jgi:hypothetical protein
MPCRAFSAVCLRSAVQVVGRLPGLLGHAPQPLRHILAVVVFLQEAGQGAAGIREQHLAHERDRAGGAFDVGDDGADAAHAAGS